MSIGEKSQLVDDIATLQAENDSLRAKLILSERDKSDLEIALETAVEHGDVVESLLEHKNLQLRDEIQDRLLAEKRLQKLLNILTQQKDDLEGLLQVITEHSDQVDFQWLEKFDVADQQAKHDGLTGLANRRSFDDYLALNWELALRNQSPLGLIMCDIDHFKFYNDHYGHQAGDECIKEVTAAIKRACTREVDMVARYGGEEFCVVLPDTDDQGAIEVANRIRTEINRLALKHEKSEKGIVTLSQGIASWIPASHQTAAGLISAADTLLYLSKQNGRDKFSYQQ